jgi:hypothetical protein
MPLVGFEPTMPSFEREKIVHALDRAATVIDQQNIGMYSMSSSKLPRKIGGYMKLK